MRIVEGSSFCICDADGEIGAATSGFFAHDTRFLSSLRLTVDGERPLSLSSATPEYFSAVFYLRNAPSGGLGSDVLSLARRRFVAGGMIDELVVRNESMNGVAFEVALEFTVDFADIFSVKAHDVEFGHADPPPLPATAEAVFDEERNRFVLRDDEGRARTELILSQRGLVRRGSVVYTIDLEPRAAWELRLEVIPSLDGADAPRSPRRTPAAELAEVRGSVAAWARRVPELSASWDDLERAIARSVSDLASLRIRRTSSGRAGEVPAAGCPWFMTIFGRDTIITSLQTLLLGPELARGTLEALSELQATADEASIDAEPGKIVHELRTGKAADHWFAAYYGTVDATPLYLVLLSEFWRWTGDATLVQQLKEPALLALDWIDRYGDRDGDGFVEYERRTERGLANQSWKDSGDSQRFADGRFARTPIAPCEVQGYVYDAKLRLSELAREVWGDTELAAKLERDARELRQRFDAAYWVEERGGYYALALDADKKRVDALSSNIGHLLWSGIVPPERADAVVRALMGDALWSGWGVRTMSTDDAAYNPLAYHNGTVWPHDNSLIASGLARYERWDEAQRIVHGIVGAAAHVDYRLPEVFAGFDRSETTFPVAYPTAAQPQAWAAGTVVLLLQVLLGLRPDGRGRALETVAPPRLPSWAGSAQLTGVRAFDRKWAVRVEDGRVHVTPT